MTRPKITKVAVLFLALFLAAGSLFAQSPEGAAQPYVIQKGDTLPAISKKFYGKDNLGQKLWQANQNLVSHPGRLTPGDTLYIFPESTLGARKSVMVPPPPVGEAPAPLYEPGKPLSLAFPKYFNFLADGRGLGGAGAVRITVKTADPKTGVSTDALYEVREVGEILATDEHGGLIYGDGAEKALMPGRTLISTNDEVMVRFTEDVARIMDSETYGDHDPYFREFPIYGVGMTAREGSAGRVDRFSSVGEMYKYKGRLTVVARVEGLVPISGSQSARLKKRGRDSKNQDSEPVVYVARITYTEDAVEVNDRVFFFQDLEPGPERRLDAPFVEPAGSYNSLGN